jgi:hypothetical protein
MAAREFAREAAEDGELFRGLPGKLRIWNSHGDHVLAVPAGFRTTGKTENAIAAIQHLEKRIHAVQFHPEVNHTEQGTAILRNFLFQVCNAEPKWSGSAFVEETTHAIACKVWKAGHLCAERRSGSTVAAVLVHRAIGDADQCLRQHRASAQERIRDTSRCIESGLGCRSSVSTPQTASSGNWRSHRSRGKAQADWAGVIAVFAEQAQRLQREVRPRHRFSGTGHSLSGCD